VYFFPFLFSFPGRSERKGLRPFCLLPLGLLMCHEWPGPDEMQTSFFPSFKNQPLMAGGRWRDGFLWGFSPPLSIKRFTKIQSVIRRKPLAPSSPLYFLIFDVYWTFKRFPPFFPGKKQAVWAERLRRSPFHFFLLYFFFFRDRDLKFAVSHATDFFLFFEGSCRASPAAVLYSSQTRGFTWTGAFSPSSLVPPQTRATEARQMLIVHGLLLCSALPFPFSTRRPGHRSGLFFPPLFPHLEHEGARVYGRHRFFSWSSGARADAPPSFSPPLLLTERLAVPAVTRQQSRRIGLHPSFLFPFFPIVGLPTLGPRSFFFSSFPVFSPRQTSPPRSPL